MLKKILQLDESVPEGFDRVRRLVIGKKDVQLERLEEVYTTENWVVRIYKVKEPANRSNIQRNNRRTNNIKHANSTYPKKVIFSASALLPRQMLYC